ncbi:nucleophile aminohydrolase [Phialemonium atrogriseum]|uniref:Nucleophile aminohydrolase n=1 Tax=Phialemonium atrogriseum TaxID=1093897 RepID=A0AAJ0C895_9PEZI|nr:nucleophile aminohydrolase [Phialemonium atrogriseum]KAK1771984.1 nucleophile aminohydrolase [Phialemonium atrogriseum]
MYGLEMVEPEYFFTQRSWDEHVRGLERERQGKGVGSWSADEYLPQGTVGAIALDEDGVVCCATSTGGMTNKLTGRIGDTPVVGAGFWAEEWDEDGDPTGTSRRGCGAGSTAWDRIEQVARRAGPVVALSESLKGLMTDCWPTPFAYAPMLEQPRPDLVATRSLAVSGTGNGDSFLRIAAARTVGSIARFATVPSGVALSRVAGPSGDLQKSAGDRWGRTGEGEGGMIGIECAVVRDGNGHWVETRSEILQDFNCGGMFRAWIDDEGEPHVRIWREE